MVEFILRALGFLACQGLFWVWTFQGPLSNVPTPTATSTLALVVPALLLKVCAFACAGFGFRRWA